MGYNLFNQNSFAKQGHPSIGRPKKRLLRISKKDFQKQFWKIPSSLFIKGVLLGNNVSVYISIIPKYLLA